MKKRRFFALFLVLGLLVSLLSVPASAFEEIDVDARAALLVEKETGEILYEKNAHEKNYPASITKLTVALLVFEAIDAGQLSLDQPITAHESAFEGLSIYGSTAGIKLYTGGLLITALDEDAPAQRAGLRAGDTILKIDGACVSSAADAVRQLSGGKSVRLLVQRGQKQAEFFLTPEKTQQGYRLGVSVRDNISGIGTITFYDPETGVCGALGHGVTGLSGMQPLAATGGILVPSVVSGVKKGVRGTPGELHGSFDVSTALGSVSQNETHGIFGTLNASPAHEAVPVADSTQVRTGAATILANVDGAEVTEYSVRIERLYPQAENGRNLLITVTDERLLEKTGGIVQGMSGSPILQDGRLVGAVTHVLVNRPEQGYGIFMQTMLSQCDAYR